MHIIYIYRRKTYQHDPKVSPFGIALVQINSITCMLYTNHINNNHGVFQRPLSAEPACEQQANRQTLVHRGTRAQSYVLL